MKEYDILIRVVFEGNTVPAELVEEMIDDIETAVYKSEENDINRLFSDSSNIQIPQVIKDASLFRLPKYRGDSLILESTKKGSFVIEATVAGLSYWILQNTLGETFKESWRETDLHQSIKRFFLSGRSQNDNQKAKDIVSNIPSYTRRHGYKENRETHKARVSTNITYEGCTVININVEQNIFDKLPPKFSELIDDQNVNKDNNK